MKYKIVHGSLCDVSTFTASVESLISKGWFLIGGVALANSGDYTIISQALAKATEPEAIDPWSAG